jgi:hypothetical protein
MFWQCLFNYINLASFVFVFLKKALRLCFSNNLGATKYSTDSSVAPHSTAKF